jgi:hypothetical protein
VRVAADGRNAHVKLAQLKGSHPAKILLHLNGLAGRDEGLPLPVDRDVDQDVTFGG